VGIEPEGMAVSPDGSWVITTSETANMAHWIDTKKQELVHNTIVDQRPRHAEFTPDGKELWVTSEIGGTVTVFDVANQQELAKLSFEIPGIHADRVQPVGMKITSDGKTAFLALGPANHIAVIDVATRKVREYLLVGRRVWHMDFSDDEKYLLTSNGLSSDVSIVDVAAEKVIKSVKVGRFPWGVATRPNN
jgi:PQQ-dependent catabolism-associated beta-propeller protein